MIVLEPVRHLLRQNQMRLRLTALFLTLLMSAAYAAPAPAPQAVEIPLSSGVLHAQLFKPEGEGPFPTVIALHACGGLSGRAEPVLSRYRDWAVQLLQSGHAVLLPDLRHARQLLHTVLSADLRRSTRCSPRLRRAGRR